MRRDFKPFYLERESNIAAEFVNKVICDLVANKLLTKKDAKQKPVVIMLAGNSNPNPKYCNSLPIKGGHGCGGYYDPNTNELIVPYLFHRTDLLKAAEYKAYTTSKYIGTIFDCEHELFYKISILHELAHWYDEKVFKSERLKHKEHFKMIYAFLRATYVNFPLTFAPAT